MKRFYIRFEILNDTGRGERKHLYLYAYSETQIRDMFKEYDIITVEETEPVGPFQWPWDFTAPLRLKNKEDGTEPVETTAWTSDGQSVVTLQGPLKPEQVVTWKE